MIRRPRCAVPRPRVGHRASRRSVLAAVLAIALAGAALIAGPQMIGRAQAAATGSPTGVAEHIRAYPGKIRYIGWAADPNTSKAISVYITVDGKKIGSTVANKPRPDVTRTHRTVGPDHGFDTYFSIKEGRHTFCVYATNVGKGANTRLRCSTYTIDFGPRAGFNNLQTKPGSIYIRGWTYDNDQPKAPVTITVTVDKKTTRVVANLPRADVATAYPSAGPNHGFSLTLPASEGAHSVCVTGINIGYGSNNTLRCATLTVVDSPVLNVGTITQQSGHLYIRGYAFDPDAPTTALAVTTTVDRVARNLTANQVRSTLPSTHPGVGTRHGFSQSLALAQGSHQVCIVARNVSYGHNTSLACRTVVLNFTPTASLDALVKTTTGVTATGWATDPDTTKAIAVHLTGNGHTIAATANRTGTSHSGHRFSVPVPMTSGSKSVCVTGINTLYGTANSKASCRTIALAYSPLGALDAITRVGTTTKVTLSGWAADPDTASALSILVTVDGKAATTLKADTTHTDVPRYYPSLSAHHGFLSTLTTDANEHTICFTAVNVGAGANKSLGCRVVIAAHPSAPSAPQAVKAVAGYGAATVTWTKPARDGGAPWTKYVITSSPAGATVTAAATATTATITGLKSATSYTFTVRAVNVGGTSAAGTSAKITTPSTPPAQRTPAPVSTSRYIRNIHGSTAADLAAMKAEGAADAAANPSGHAYLILLDIGGQDQYDGGVVLSATTRFISYASLVKDIEAYTAGYHSKQKSSAPVTIAIGTNNDMDVSASSGAAWATKVVAPVASYAKGYASLTVAGANDIEPGFRATYTQTKAWLSGYLGATKAPFVFNGSADGCAWTVTNRGCNNGWSMSGLYTLAGGAAPTRTSNLPQIYNTTMAAQWKFISLTGIAQGKPRINFGGTLTEWTACDQTNSCGSLTGRTAWTALWNNLQSDARLKVSTLPYATDLRIDK